MKRYRLHELTAFFGVLFVAYATSAAERGNLTGRLVVDGVVPPPATFVLPRGVNLVDESLVVGEGNALQNVFVYLRTKGVEVAPRYAATANDELALDVKNGRFEPHTLVLRTSQTLKITNSDVFGVNAKLDGLKNPASNLVLPAGASATARLAGQESLPIGVGCNIHARLRGWLLVRDSPYAAVSGSDGTFTIRDLPAGVELEFQLWQERPGYLRDVSFRGGMSDAKGRFKLKLNPGDNNLGDMRVPARLLLR